MQLSWESVLVIASGLVVLSNAFKAVAHFLDPFTKVKDKLKKHDEQLLNDHARIEMIQQTSNLMCKSMMVLLEHEITGNSVEKLKGVKKEIQEFLIERK